MIVLWCWITAQHPQNHETKQSLQPLPLKLKIFRSSFSLKWFRVMSTQHFSNFCNFVEFFNEVYLGEKLPKINFWLGNSNFQIRLWSCGMDPGLQRKIFKIEFWRLGCAVFRVWYTVYFATSALNRFRKSVWVSWDKIQCEINHPTNPLKFHAFGSIKLILIIFIGSEAEIHRFVRATADI